MLHIIYRIQCEVDEVLGKKDYVTIGDLEKLEYVEQVKKNYYVAHDIDVVILLHG